MGEPLACPDCPTCGHPPKFILPGDVQAFCGNDDCTTLCWNPSETAAENRRSVGEVTVETEVDPAEAILLSGFHVRLADAVRGGQADQTIAVLMLVGRVNKNDEEVSALYVTDPAGLTAIVGEVFELARRARAGGEPALADALGLTSYGQSPEAWEVTASPVGDGHVVHLHLGPSTLILPPSEARAIGSALRAAADAEAPTVTAAKGEAEPEATLEEQYRELLPQIAEALAAEPEPGRRMFMLGRTSDLLAEVMEERARLRALLVGQFRDTLLGLFDAMQCGGDAALVTNALNDLDDMGA